MNLTQAGNEYRNGATLKVLAAKMKTNYSAIRQKLIAAGVTMRTRKRATDDFFIGELVTFNGREYFPNHKGYMRARQDPRTYLHRDVFEFFTGRKIKPGHDVNHRDHNKLNWLVCNLQEIDHDGHAIETANWLKENGPGPVKSDNEVPF